MKTNYQILEFFRQYDVEGSSLLLLSDPSQFEQQAKAALKGIPLSTLLTVWLRRPRYSLQIRISIHRFYKGEVTITDLQPHLLSSDGIISGTARGLVFALLGDETWKRKAIEEMPALADKNRRLSNVLVRLIKQKHAVEQVSEEEVLIPGCDAELGHSDQGSLGTGMQAIA
jgi:hypothetical protein